MKIICIGLNYMDHVKESNDCVPEAPLIFIKPDTALLRNNNPFYYPEFSQNIHYEAELVIKIDRIGRHIDKRFAYRYYSEVGVGIDFTARDLQRKFRKEGLPWEIAKGFDHSAPVGKFLKKEDIKDLNDMRLQLDINGKTVQKGSSLDMIFPVDELISYVSRFFTLKIGDLIFTGTPAGVGPVNKGDRLCVSLNSQILLDFYVK